MQRWCVSQTGWWTSKHFDHKIRAQICRRNGAAIPHPASRSILIPAAIERNCHHIPTNSALITTPDRWPRMTWIQQHIRLNDVNSRQPTADTTDLIILSVWCGEKVRMQIRKPSKRADVLFIQRRESGEQIMLLIQTKFKDHSTLVKIVI